MTFKTNSSGTVAAIAPSPPMVRKQPLTNGQERGGNHRVIALKLAIKPPQTPKPMIARPMATAVKSEPTAKMKAPAAAQNSRYAWTPRGPKRSNNTPRGSCEAAKVMK